MSFIVDNKISLDDTYNLSAFSRLRTTDARLIFESRYMYGEGASTEFNDLVANGGSLVADQARNCYHATIGTVSGARALRQSKQYSAYISGTSNIGLLSFTMNVPKQNLVQSVGMFDDLNGFILRQSGTQIELVIRKNGVDNEVFPKEQWNIDRLDGTKSRFNPSGIFIDLTKSQILTIDYQWLGVGRVRFGFVIGGQFHVVHEANHANMVTEVYTNQPSLPVRWEIYNSDITNSASSLMMICAAVYCEGAEYETGFSRSVSSDGASISLTSANSANGYGILAIRLRNVLVGKQNHALARLKNWSMLSTANARYKIVILPNKSFLGNPSISWTKVPGYGWCEYIKDFTMATNWNVNNDYSVLVEDFVAGASGNSSGNNSITGVDNRTNMICQNYDSTDSQILAIIGYRITQDASVHAAMNWIEVK